MEEKFGLKITGSRKAHPDTFNTVKPIEVSQFTITSVKIWRRYLSENRKSETVQIFTDAPRVHPYGTDIGTFAFGEWCVWGTAENFCRLNFSHFFPIQVQTDHPDGSITFSEIATPEDAAPLPQDPDVVRN